MVGAEGVLDGLEQVEVEAVEELGAAVGGLGVGGGGRRLHLGRVLLLLLLLVGVGVVVVGAAVALVRPRWVGRRLRAVAVA